MKYIDLFCKILGGVSAIIVALSMMYVCFMAALGQLIAPPSSAFAGLFGIMSAGFVALGSHIIKGDFFNDRSDR